MTSRNASHNDEPIQRPGPTDKPNSYSLSAATAAATEVDKLVQFNKVMLLIRYSVACHNVTCVFFRMTMISTEEAFRRIWTRGATLIRLR